MNQETRLLSCIYHNAAAASQSIGTMLPRVKDDVLSKELEDQKKNYDHYADRAKTALTDLNSRPKGKVAQKLGIPVGVTLGTMLNSSPARIAEMRINSSTMGVVDISKELRGQGEGTPAANLGRELLSVEQENINRLKTYL